MNPSIKLQFCLLPIFSSLRIQYCIMWRL